MFVAIALLSIVPACKGAAPTQTESGGPPVESGPIKAVGTIGMVTDVVRIVGGEHVRAAGLMGPGTDPHLYKASESDIRLLSGADIVFYNGLHLEGKLGDILVSLARKKPVIPVTGKIDPAKLREPPEFQGNYDPHVWFDVSMWASAAAAIRDGLAEVVPAHKADFEKNAAAYVEELRALHQWVGEQIRTIPPERRVLITAHDAFGYFGRAYGLEVRGIQGISTESEAGVKEINALVDLISSRGVKAVFVESSVPRKNVEALVEGARSRGAEVTVGGELFSDAMGAEGSPEGTYVGMVRHNVNTIVTALK
ncbi:MAG: zinc ABC transporter substrate-binding protein [Deltaproteobacteria bacterium]|nr:zinc ABC transporter substrate-binding protein [Deltaproteobacteria bacterium]